MSNINKPAYISSAVVEVIFNFAGYDDDKKTDKELFRKIDLITTIVKEISLGNYTVTLKGLQDAI